MVWLVVGVPLEDRSNRPKSPPYTANSLLYGSNKNERNTLTMSQAGIADHDLTKELIEFLDDYYRTDIGRLAQKYPKDQKSLYIEWKDIWRFDREIGDLFLENPSEMIDYLEEALSQYDLPIDVNLSDAHVRVTNVPDTHTFSVGETRSDDLNNYLALSGQATKVSDVKPKATVLCFECQRCGTTSRMPQVGNERTEPHECQGCERQGPFRVDFNESELVDHQLVRLQKPPGESKGAQGETIDVVLEDDLVNTLTAGDRVEAAGILEIEDDDELTFDTYVEGHAAEVEETDFDEIDVSEYEEQIREIANDEPIEQLTNSLAPKIRGYDDIKEAIILQLFGGVKVEYPDGQVDRGDSHILLLGDPGCGKSTLLRSVEEIAPRSTYASGKGASAAGMTGAAVRDDFGDTEWGIEAGALVLAHKGIACVDEIDKVDEDAVSSLHDALESQKVEIAKAGINATLDAETALLAAGNPKYGRFDRHEEIGEQIDLGPTLLSRFDLMFMLSDEPDEEEDRQTAEHMVESRRKANEYTHNPRADPDELGEITPDIAKDVMRAYIAYAKQNVHPQIPESVSEKIVDWYTELRKSNSDEDGPVPVTARKVEAMERLAEASARARLSDVVEDEDVERAGRLVMTSMRDVGVDPETDEFDADVVETGMSKSQRDRIQTVKEIITETEKEYDEGVPVEIVLQEAMDRDMGKSATKHEIEQLKQKGEVYEPRTDHLRPT